MHTACVQKLAVNSNMPLVSLFQQIFQGLTIWLILAIGSHKWHSFLPEQALSVKLLAKGQDC